MNKGTTATASRLLCLLGIVLAASICNAALATEIYTWTDKGGVMHFSDTKPIATESNTIEIKDNANQASYSPPAPAAPPPVDTETGEQPLSAAQQRRTDIAENRRARTERQAEKEQMCSQHQIRLEQMEPARRVYYKDENGQEVRMDDNQRMSLIEESRNYISENCN